MAATITVAGQGAVQLLRGDARERLGRRFAVADAVLAGNATVAMERLRWALETGMAPVLITSALASAVRGLAVVVQSSRGLSESELAKQAKVPPWKLRTLRQQARGWTPRGVAQAMRARGEDGSIVTILCDGGERYEHSYYNPDWYAAEGIDIEQADRVIAEAADGDGPLPDLQPVSRHPPRA